jgi:hypothetical protein
VVSLKNHIQQDKAYLEYLVRKENTEANRKIIRGRFYQEMQQAIDYDRWVLS